MRTRIDPAKSARVHVPGRADDVVLPLDLAELHVAEAELRDLYASSVSYLISGAPEATRPALTLAAFFKMSADLLLHRAAVVSDGFPATRTVRRVASLQQRAHQLSSGEARFTLLGLELKVPQPPSA